MESVAHGDSGGPLFYNGKITATVAGHTDGDWPGHRNEYYVRTDLVSSAIASMSAQLTSECENQMCYTPADCIANGDGSACTCLAEWYTCLRNVCGERRPVISCRF